MLHFSCIIFRIPWDNTDLVFSKFSLPVQQGARTRMVYAAQFEKKDQQLSFYFIFIFRCLELRSPSSRPLPSSFQRPGSSLLSNSTRGIVAPHTECRAGSGRNCRVTDPDGSALIVPTITVKSSLPASNRCASPSHFPPQQGMQNHS